MQHRHRLAVVGFTTLTVLGTVYAAAPTYEGRALPESVKSIVWQKACNLPDADGDGPCAGGDCLQRTDGTIYRPAVSPWQSVFMYEWAAAERVLGPGFAEGKAIGSIDDIDGQTRVALELVSGLPLQAKSAVDGPLALNPALVAWVQRELLPAADHPMCGTTATQVYQAAFKAPVRGLAETYAALHKKGMTRGVTIAALSRSFDTGKGRFTQACEQIGKAAGQDGSWARVQECWWWLRRVATGTAEPIAQIVGEMLRRYDAEAWGKLGRAFPKPPKPVVAPQ